jgi:hypothetical protein
MVYERITINGVRKYLHVHIAEKALGKSLPKGAHVHHVDYNKKNNANSNLVICPNNAYHALLHQRQDAVNAGYPAHYRRCSYCQEYDSPDNLYIKQGVSGLGWACRHQSCLYEYEKLRKKQSA